jgi:hypothetical protein
MHLGGPAAIDCEESQVFPEEEGGLEHEPA